MSRSQLDLVQSHACNASALPPWLMAMNAVEIVNGDEWCYRLQDCKLLVPTGKSQGLLSLARRVSMKMEHSKSQ